MKPFADIHVHMTDTVFDHCRPFLDELADQDVTHIALQSLTYHNIAYNLSVLYWKEHYKRMEISAFGMVHNQDFYSEIPYEIQAKALIDMGCDGIKFMYSPDTRRSLGHAICDSRYDKMFTYLEENNIPVLIHVNDPEHFWEKRELTEYEIMRGWGYFDPSYLSKQEIYDETFSMLDKHPSLRVTFAHFFFLSNYMEEAERVLNTYPYVHFDLTPGSEMFLGFSKDIDAWQAFFQKYSDRILFGTDCNNLKDFNPLIYQLVRQALTHDKSEFCMPCYSGAPVKGLDLDEDTLRKICFDNYRNFVGTPKPVNMALVKKAAERVYRDTKQSDDVKIKKAADWAHSFLAEYSKE